MAARLSPLQKVVAKALVLDQLATEWELAAVYQVPVQTVLGLFANHRRGLRGGRTKLTDDQVRQILDMYPDWNQAELSSEFRLSRSCVGEILQGKTYKHVKRRIRYHQKEAI